MLISNANEFFHKTKDECFQDFKISIEENPHRSEVEEELLGMISEILNSDEVYRAFQNARNACVVLAEKHGRNGLLFGEMIYSYLRIDYERILASTIEVQSGRNSN